MYLWLKAFHIIFVVCWFAGLFYLPRILVHYAGSDNEAVRAHLAMMAQKLYRFVTPFMFITIVLLLAWLTGWAPEVFLMIILVALWGWSAGQRS